MKVRELIALLEFEPQDAEVLVWDPAEEIAGTIRGVQDIHTPTDAKETFIIADFG